jgi:hypothetical protein
MSSGLGPSDEPTVMTNLSGYKKGDGRGNTLGTNVRVPTCTFSCPRNGRAWYHARVANVIRAEAAPLRDGTHSLRKRNGLLEAETT